MQRDLPFAGQRLCPVQDARDDFGEAYHVALEVIRSGVEAGQRQKAGGDCREVFGLDDDVFEQGGVVGAELIAPAQQHLGIGAQQGERRAQLV